MINRRAIRRAESRPGGPPHARVQILVCDGTMDSTPQRFSNTSAKEVYLGPHSSPTGRPEKSGRRVLQLMIPGLIPAGLTLPPACSVPAPCRHPLSSPP